MRTRQLVLLAFEKGLPLESGPLCRAFQLSLIFSRGHASPQGEPCGCIVHIAALTRGMPAPFLPVMVGMPCFVLPSSRTRVLNAPQEVWLFADDENAPATQKQHQ
jgi:hypothetical protein